MKTSLVRIGNSRGVRIPKTIVEQCGFVDDVDLRVKGGAVVITALRKPRAGWAELFKRAEPKGATPVPDNFGNAFDDKEWRW